MSAHAAPLESLRASFPSVTTAALDAPWEFTARRFVIRAGVHDGITPFYSWVPGPELAVSWWEPMGLTFPAVFEWSLEASYLTGRVRSSRDNMSLEEGDRPGDARSAAQRCMLGVLTPLFGRTYLVNHVGMLAIGGGVGLFAEEDVYEWEDYARVGATYIKQGDRLNSTTRVNWAVNFCVGWYGPGFGLRIDFPSASWGTRSRMMAVSVSASVLFDL